MKRDQHTVNGNGVKGKACQLSDELVADEIQAGTREELIGRLQTKYGYSKEKAEARAWPVFLMMAGRVRKNASIRSRRYST
ncbi:MAG: hypothetical protein ACREYF_18455 [Gammaproteobacteria bacterium]